MPKTSRLNHSPFFLSLFLLMTLTQGRFASASMFSSFTNHLLGQAKAVVRNPGQAISQGINHTVGKIEAGVKSVGKNLKAVGNDLKNGDIGKAASHLAQATISTIQTSQQILGPIGSALEGGPLAVITSTVVDAAKESAVTAVRQSLTENQRETLQKTQEVAALARTVAELTQN